MLDNGLSADQIRNATGVKFSEAQAACYMALAANSGWSLARFVENTDICAPEARALAYKFGIGFSDYDPFAQPVTLAWHKLKDGWELRRDDEVVGACYLSADAYSAKAFGFVERMSRPRDAMRKLSARLDASAPDLFDSRPVQVFLCNKEGGAEAVLHPNIKQDVLNRCRASILRDRQAA